MPLFQVEYAIKARGSKVVEAPDVETADKVVKEYLGLEELVYYLYENPENRWVLDSADDIETNVKLLREES